MPTFRPFTASGIYVGGTDPKVEDSRNSTDVTAPVVKLYIEGVEVPFISISVGQAYGRKPMAEVQVPPESGLLDIIRGYEPKVHIFYKDENYGGMRLLFWGRIVSSNYSRSTQGTGSTSISFRCEHKNTLMDQVVLDFTGWANRNNPSLADPNRNQAIKVNAFNSSFLVVEALKGITGIASEGMTITRSNPNIADALIDKVDPSLTKHYKRLLGLGSIPVSIWNRLKKFAYEKPTLNVALETMYIPLIEEGLSFFKRLSGHPYLENQVQAAKQPYCHVASDGKEALIMTPPSLTLPLMSAEQQQLAVEIIHSQLGFSGELASYEQILQNFYGSMQYEMLTLASPAEIPADPDTFVADLASRSDQQMSVELAAIETIVKPQLPMYYSPICNVLLPRMYSSINIDQEEGGLPSRVTATYDTFAPTGQTSDITLSYRGPHSIREAVAYNSLLTSGANSPILTLSSTKTYSYSIPGMYEQGRGIKPEVTAFPWWLGVFASNKSQGSVINSERAPEKGTPDYHSMMALTADWRLRNGVYVYQADADLAVIPAAKKYKLNPYDPTNEDIRPHERLFFSTVDYEYSKRIMGAKSGTISATFNPYIIPGYPMDVIDDSPNHPSFHGLCTSVTHSITPSSISTSIGMAAVTTYAELSNYYNPPSPPFLQTALNLVNADIDAALLNSQPAGSAEPYSNVKSTLLQNPKAKEAADTFYKQVLGVGAAAPEDLIHFASGRAYPVDRLGGIFQSRVIAAGNAIPDMRGHDLIDSNGRHLVDYYSAVGNLRLVSRPIESQDSIAKKFGYNFINLDRSLYNNTYVNYRNPVLASNFLLEPGASLFLDYMEMEDFIKTAKSR